MNSLTNGLFDSFDSINKIALQHLLCIYSLHNITVIPISFYNLPFVILSRWNKTFIWVYDYYLFNVLSIVISNTIYVII